VRNAMILIFMGLFSCTLFASPVANNINDTRVEIVASNSGNIRLAFDLTDVELTNIDQEGETGTSHMLVGEGGTLEFGRPQLPAVTRLVVIPPNAGLELIIHTSEPRIVTANHPPALYLDEELTIEGQQMDNFTGVYPVQLAEMDDPIVIRGVRLVRVTTYPVHYDYDNNTYLYYDNIEAELIYTDAEPINPATHPVRKNRSQYFLRFIRGLAINGDQVGRDDPQAEKSPYVGHYCIVANEQNLMFEGVFEFIEWRRRAGYKVDIISIPNNRSSDQYSNEIKEQVQDLYDSYLEDGEDPFDLVMLVGDRSSYQNCGTGQIGAMLGAPRGNNLWGGVHIHHYDWFYGLLEGNDIFADVGVSRWAAGNRPMHDLWWGRTKAYEVEPNMDEQAWFTKGAVYAQRWGGNYHRSLATNVRWGKSVLESKGFDDIGIIESMTGANVAQIGAFLIRHFNDGTNLMLGRAENYHFRSGFVNTGVDFNQELGVFPIDLNIAGHHEWTTWWMLRSGDSNNFNGPVVATTGYGGQATLAYNICWVEEVNGFVQRDLPLGWARVQALTGPELYIPNWRTRFPGQAGGNDNACFTDVDFYGDPGIQYWQGVPQMVEADFPEVVSPDVRLVTIHVTDADDGENVEGATVTLYAPGNMPDFDDNDYPDYDGMQMWMKKSDANGTATFIFGDDVELNPRYPLQLTVLGRNIRPLLEEIDIDTPDDELVIEVIDYELTETEGNDNGEINPGEVYTIAFSAANLSNEIDAENIMAEITTESEYIEIVGATELAFGNIGNGETVESEDLITISFSTSIPDGNSRPSTMPVLLIDFSDGENSWKSAIQLSAVSPDFALGSIIGGNVISTEEEDVELDIDIINVGGFDAAQVTANLFSLGLGIVVMENEASYGNIEAGDHSRIDGNKFHVSGNLLSVPGSIAPMALVFSANDQFIDTTYFDLIVGTPGRNKPQGPDNYGYICFDDTDEDWEIAPEYDWIEISRQDRDRDYDGTSCDFDGRSEQNIGETLVIDLPFDFQFYGNQYNQLTIATNGFASVGDQEYVTNFQNWPLDRNVGGLGMMAPFWDDLNISDGQVYYHYIENEDEISYFVIEWYELRARAGGGGDLTFEIVILDMPTETGDNTIKFNYKSVINRSSGDWNNTVPFASVGISSPEGNAGLNYSYNNQYPVTSSVLENRRSLLFATSPKYKSGVLIGRVIDVATEEPIEDVLVVTQYGQAARTDSLGIYHINNAIADVEFSITAMIQGYNDSTLHENIIEEDDTLMINFALLHPEFNPSIMNMQTRLDPGASRDLSFNIRNDGNGPLSWSVIPRLPGNAGAEPWEFREDFHFGDQLEDRGIYGVVYINDQFYVSGSNRADDDEGNQVSRPTIYILDSEGALIDTFAQPGENRYGMKDLTFDGELLWGAVGNDIYGITLEGEVVTTFDAPHHPSSAIVWDPDREVLWIAGTTSDPVGVDREGNEVDGMRISRDGLYFYGLTYFADDPDDSPLYFLTKERETNRQAVLKYNFETEEQIFVAYFNHDEGGSPQGAFITNTYDVYSWVFMSVSNNAANDRIDIHQIEGRMDWFQLDLVTEEGRQEANDGELQTGETGEFILHFDALDLPLVDFETELHFYHNAMGGHTQINGLLSVIGPTKADSFDLVSPPDSSFFDDLEVEFGWYPSFDPNENEEITYHLWLQSGEDTYSFELVDTTFAVRLDTAVVLLEEDMDFNWWVLALSGEDTIESGHRFSFNLLYNAVGDEDGLTPVEYGLKSIYPNPFNSVTSITFGADLSEHIRLVVYDISGREIVRLFDGVPRRGYHRLSWRADRVPTGVYLLRMESPGRSRVAKIALVK
jgi:hypothetical protein